MQCREDRPDLRVRQRQQPTVIEGDEKGFFIVAVEIEEVAVCILGHGPQEIDDPRQQVDTLAVDRDADVELEPVDAAALMQLGVDVFVGFGEGWREAGLDFDPPALVAQPGRDLEQEAGPGEGIVVGEDEAIAHIRRESVTLLGRGGHHAGIVGTKPPTMLAFKSAVAFDRKQATIPGEQRLVAPVAGRQDEGTVGEGEPCELKILGRRRGRSPGILRDRGSNGAPREPQNGHGRAGDDLRRRRLDRKQVAMLAQSIGELAAKRRNVARIDLGGLHQSRGDSRRKVDPQRAAYRRACVNIPRGDQADRDAAAVDRYDGPLPAIVQKGPGDATLPRLPACHHRSVERSPVTAPGGKYAFKGLRARVAR